MLKYAAAAITGILALAIISADGVIIEDNTPTYIQPGETKAVTVTINKGNVEGFAKLELILPAGLSAEAISTQEASFTFEGQKAKFIWMALPDMDEFTVSYNLTASDAVEGALTITGVFAYIKDNQRVDYALQDKTVTIGSSASSEDETAEEVSTEDEESSEETSAGTEEVADAAADAMPELQAYEGDDLQCLRYMTQTSPSEYRVLLRVVNNNLDGFAKITESIPAGMSIAEDDSDAAVVTVEDDGIKYVWFDAPKSSSFEVSYLLQQVTSVLPPSIDGNFSFVQGNAPFEQAVMSMGATQNPEFQDAVPDEAYSEEIGETPERSEEEPMIDEEIADDMTKSVEEEMDDASQAADALADDVSDQAEDVADAAEDTMEDFDDEVDQVESTFEDNVSDSELDDQVADNTVDEEVEEAVEEVVEEVLQQSSGSGSQASAFPDPEVGITYKVQIAAAHRTVGKSYFTARHSFTEGFNIENHDGWVKYTTGKHSEYKNARDSRNRITGDYPTLPGPFVTAYNEGERITVQEALMIANQQWYE